MVALEDAFQTRIDEGAFAEAREHRPAARARRAGADSARRRRPSRSNFPSWNRSWLARAIRRVSLPTWILPLARVFAWMRVEGPRAPATASTARSSSPRTTRATWTRRSSWPRCPPAGGTAWRRRWRRSSSRRTSSPTSTAALAWFTNSLNYYLAALFFNAFPLPQREAGARQTLRYIGDVLEDGFSVLIFPEGKRTDTGAIDRFRPGIGMIASRLDVPVVPVRLEGLDRVLHHTWRMATPGRVRVAFGAPLRLTGEDYEALAKPVEDAVRAL